MAFKIALGESAAKNHPDSDLYIDNHLAGAQVRYPNVPIVFCETRKLAEEWAYRFLGAIAAPNPRPPAKIARPPGQRSGCNLAQSGLPVGGDPF